MEWLDLRVLQDNLVNLDPWVLKEETVFLALLALKENRGKREKLVRLEFLDHQEKMASMG